MGGAERDAAAASVAGARAGRSVAVTGAGESVAGAGAGQSVAVTGAGESVAGARAADDRLVAGPARGEASTLRLVQDPRDVETLPDPGLVAAALARCVAEILSGSRELDTIARWITDDVHRSLVQRVAIAARARSVARRAVGRPVIRVGPAVVDRSRQDVVEAAVVVHARSRSRAVTMRLEVRDGRWRATTIGIL